MRKSVGTEPPRRSGQSRGPKGPLTEQQRALVRDNLGLVLVHLRRHIRSVGAPHRDREWEDLFQEGCLGLVRAAAAYRPERGISFVAFALPRIRHMVSKAVQNAFATIRVPPKQLRLRAVAHSPDVDQRFPAPKVYSLSAERCLGLAARESRGVNGPYVETIGERLRQKFEQAARAAETELGGHISARGDLDRLVRVVTEDRLLVPRVDARQSIRSIAQQTQSSSARVTQTERRLTAMIRSVLEVDPEFKELWRLARADPMGTDVPIDAEVEGILRSAGADELLRRYRLASFVDRARMLQEVLEGSHADI